MKTIKLYLSVLIIFLSISKTSFSQEWESVNFGNQGNSINFLNENTGFIGLKINNGQNWAIYKTNNKGVSFSQIWSTPVTTDNSRGFGFDMINESIGYVFIKSTLFRTSNGGISWQQKYELQYSQSDIQSIKFFNDNLGFITITFEGLPYNAQLEVWRVTNGGINRSRVYQSPQDHKVPVISSISISSTNSDKVIMTGFFKDYTSGGQNKLFSLNSSNGGLYFSPNFNGLNNTKFANITFLPNSSTEYRILGSQENGLFDPNTGSFCYNNIDAAVKYKITNSTNNIAGLSFVDANKGYAYIGDTIYKTTNSGVNWSSIYALNSNSTTNLNSLNAFNDIIYVVDQIGNLVTHRLPTNLYSYFDNQSSPGSMMFDNISYNTPSLSYLRGGNSNFSSSNILNQGQGNERIFYKWNNNNMNSSLTNIYLDNSGSTYANYYKTKQLSTTSSAISNSGQSKIIKDGLGALNQIHQSMDGGIFYTKSYNNGISYKSEEVLNNTPNHSIADGNKNPSLVETRLYAPTTGGYPVNKNVTACWERFNSASGKTEIKAAVRNYNIFADTSFFWQSWEDVNYSDVFTEFTSSAGYNSNPKIFSIAMDPVSNLGNPSTYFLIIPHLRPSSNGSKIQVTCRKGNLYQEFALDSGDISDLSVIDSANSYGYIRLHFTYNKNNQIIYRKVAFENYSNLPIVKYNLEGPVNISSGDGYSSRSKPDISLMNGVPVVSYAANYNANVLVEYEGGGTDVIPINRYPIIKVQRIDATHWGNYVIYNSNNIQDNPDIEGSTDTKSYLLNYSLGSGQFKKVVSVFGKQGYFCDPNIFTGTDSKLIKNSYSGLYGNNLSMLTLSPNSGLYKLDKQGFVITNINTADNVDNLGGIVNLDTVRYSFNLGPILIKENSGDNSVTAPFGEAAESDEPILTPAEFNQNLRSDPFLLNESQALLVGCYVTYIKDNNDVVVNNLRYNVNLINKSTELLHRVLYSDTLHAEDSVANEFLRGFYITNIPNDEDSFYVQISVNYDDIAGGNYYLNPGYSDAEPMGDNSSGHKTKIIYENDLVNNSSNSTNSNNSIPEQYSLNQNYPNPFNPVTKIKFAIPLAGFTTLKVYDISGKEISKLINSNIQAGSYEVLFDATNFSSGVYFYRLESNGFVQTRKMFLIK